VLAEVDHAGLPRQVILDQITGRARKQHLASMAGGADAGCPMDGQPEVALLVDGGFARVDPDPDADL
jgi:hypothetical protein